MKYKFKPSHIVPAFLFVVAVLYGGSKPSMPTNAPMMIGCTTTTANYDSLTAWHKRGAYCDWERIDFPDAFRFPVGTNFIDGVTLFAYGEVRIKRGSGVSPLVGNENLPLVRRASPPPLLDDCRALWTREVPDLVCPDADDFRPWRNRRGQTLL